VLRVVATSGMGVHCAFESMTPELRDRLDGAIAEIEAGYRPLISVAQEAVLSGLAPAPLADKGSIGYRAASHEGGGRGCGAWNAGRRR
jgi:hypothetical protein